MSKTAARDAKGLRQLALAIRAADAAHPATSPISDVPSTLIIPESLPALSRPPAVIITASPVSSCPGSLSAPPSSSAAGLTWTSACQPNLDVAFSVASPTTDDEETGSADEDTSNASGKAVEAEDTAMELSSTDTASSVASRRSSCSESKIGPEPYGGELDPEPESRCAGADMPPLRLERREGVLSRRRSLHREVE